MKIAKVDAALDAVGGDEVKAGHKAPDCVAEALADLLDGHGAWDWTDEAEYEPSDRITVVESSGAWWAIYRGTEPDEAWRFGSEDSARRRADEWIEQLQA